MNSLVYNHLKLTAPVTAAEFRANHKFTVTSHSFQDFVRKLLSRYHPGKERGTSGRVHKPMRRYSTVLFTPEEDARILAECSTTASGRISKLAVELGRHGESIRNRYDILKKGIKQLRRFNQADDQVILDAVIERLPGKRLVDVSSSLGKWTEIGDTLKKNRKSVMTRWYRNLLPMLLQHYSGTSNLRVELMLAN